MSSKIFRCHWLNGYVSLTLLLIFPASILSVVFSSHRVHVFSFIHLDIPIITTPHSFEKKKNSGFPNHSPYEICQGSANDLIKSRSILLSLTSQGLSAPFGIVNYHLLLRIQLPFSICGCRSRGYRGLTLLLHFI